MSRRLVLLFSSWILLLAGPTPSVPGKPPPPGDTVEPGMRAQDVRQRLGPPDRIARQGETLIPEEWKSSKRVSDGHRLQLGAYFILIEEEYGVRPPFGVVVLGDGSRVKVENTERLRSKVLAIAEKIREHRRGLREEIPVRQPAWKCRICGQRANCTLASPQ